jgi:hypothetical protein
VTEWPLYDAIGTHERFYHIINNFVDYLARPHNVENALKNFGNLFVEVDIVI